EDRMEAYGHNENYTRERLRELGHRIIGFVLMDIFYSAPIEGALIYLWGLPSISGVWKPALIDALLLSPILVDPMAYYVGKIIFNRIDKDKQLSLWDPHSHQIAIESIREHLADFFLMALPVWFVSVVLSMYTSHSRPVLSFTFLNT